MLYQSKPSKTIYILLWIAQAVLRATLIWVGGMKLFQSYEGLAKNWPWTTDDTGLTRFTGVLDVVAGVGPLLPLSVCVASKLKVYAPSETIPLMISAIIFRLGRADSLSIGVNAFLVSVAVFIARGRRKKALSLQIQRLQQTIVF